MMRAEMPSKEPIQTFTISELANEFGITPRAIRYYEEVGLLASLRNSPTGHRHYTARDRGRLKLILRGKRFGYSLAELSDILNLYDADPTQKKQIKRTLEYGIRHIQEIDERVEELQELRREMIEFAMSFLKIVAEGEDDESEEVQAYIKGARSIVRTFRSK